MSGKKGRSGRYSPYQDHDLKVLSKLSHRTIIRALEDETIPLEKRASIAAPFVLKRMPNKLEVETIHSIAPDQQKALISSLRAIFGQYKEPITIEAQPQNLGQEMIITPLKDDLAEESNELRDGSTSPSATTAL